MPVDTTDAPAPLDMDGPIPAALARELTQRLEPVALQCEGREVRELDRADVVRVSAFDVRMAVSCQARAAAPPDEFEPNLRTTTRAVAIRAGRRIRRFPTELEAVADTVKTLRLRRVDESPFDPDEWLILHLQSVPIDVRARLVARATTWLTTTLDLVSAQLDIALGLDADDGRPCGAGPIERREPNSANGGGTAVRRRATRGWQWEPKAAWSYPGRGLRLETKVDLALPEPGNFTPVVVTAGGVKEQTIDQIAYSTVLWTINRRRAPDKVLLVARDEHSVRVLNPDDLWERGIDAAVTAAEAVVLRTAGTPVGATRATALGDPSVELPPGVEYGSFPLDLAVCASFVMCVDCGWRNLCPSRHPDAATAPAAVAGSHDPADSDTSSAALEPEVVTVRGGVRMPHSDGGRH